VHLLEGQAELLDGRLHAPTTLSRLPYRSHSGDLLPPWTARAGMVPWPLAPAGSAPVATATGWIDPEGAAPHTLVVKTWPLDADPSSACAVAVAVGGQPRAAVWTLRSHDAGTWAFDLSRGGGEGPVQVVVSDCTLRGLDVFPVSVTPSCARP